MARRSKAARHQEANKDRVAKGKALRFASSAFQDDPSHANLKRLLDLMPAPQKLPPQF